MANVCVTVLFLLCYILNLRRGFQVQAPGGLCLDGRFNEGFFALRVWGAYIWRDLFTEFCGTIVMTNVMFVSFS